MTGIDPQTAALESLLRRAPDLHSGTGVVQIYRALPGGYLNLFRDRPLACRQTFRPLAEELERMNLNPLAESDVLADLAIVFATKHKEEVLYHCALAVERLTENGRLIVSAANDLGAASLERRCKALLGTVDTYSKHKCRVFHARKRVERLDRALLQEWLNAGELRRLPESGLYSRPGLFSWKTVDAGSRLLAEHLPPDLSGTGADLGAGYGYLSRELLLRSSRIAELHVVEAERNALDAAECNLAEVACRAALHYRWVDVTAGLPLSGLDFVIMNPPFHTGRDTVSALGRAFVRSGLNALKPGGRLCMVANRHLPYEAEIERMSGQLLSSVESGGFKVQISCKTA